VERGLPFVCVQTLKPRGTVRHYSAVDAGDLRYAARDVADMVRDVQHLPDQLLRSGVLFAPASKLPPSVTRLHDRATGRYVSILPNEMAELANTTRSATRASDLAVGKVVMGLSVALTARVPEL